MSYSYCASPSSTAASKPPFSSLSDQTRHWRFSSLTLINRPKLTAIRQRHSPQIYCCSDSAISASPSPAAENTPPPRMIKKKARYRKQYPGEREGITEEMRFVAMRLRNVNGKKVKETDRSGDGEEEDDESVNVNGGGGGDTWQPSMAGLLRFLVDSKLVFDTIERIVDESNDVSYAYFRKTGLERSVALSKDLEWFSQQEIAIPPPSNPGVTYAKYLEELAEKSAPLFLCHFYNVYFSHIAGGQVITRQASEKILEGRELQFYTWDGNAEELLKGVRDNLNMLAEHWSRDEKNKCLREATKAFRYLGQIVRLLIL